MKNAIDSLYDSVIGDVWQHFARISEIPRPSKYEAKIRNYLKGIARDQNWTIREDRVGNMVFEIPGSGSFMNAPILVLQGHMDMVCEKNSDVVHDFFNDPIKLCTDGTWVTAEGTTLGADNGIAIALMLSIAQSELPDRLPLELLLTVDEETGLTGAMNLDNTIVRGQRLLNLDTEDDGVLTIGCSGGRDMMIYYSYQSQGSSSSSPCHTVHIKGFQGGHSGVNIHEKRANAILVAAKFLTELRRLSPELKLCEFHGGNKKNAIPREVIFTVANCNETDLNNTAALIIDGLKKMGEKKDIIIQSESTVFPKNLIPLEIIDFISAVPNGVIAMDKNFSDMVQTSSSVGVVSRKNGELEILIHGRSSSKEALDNLEGRLRTIALNNNGRFVTGAGYPGWAPNPNSLLLQRGKNIYRNLFNKDPKVISMHAGLETGILGTILGTEELLSVGPTIQDAHSPTERLNVMSVENTYNFLKEFVSDKAFA